MAASDCSFCGQHGVPCVLRKGTAAICGPCASKFANRTPDQQATRARFERELELADELARDRAAGISPERGLVSRRFDRELVRARRQRGLTPRQPSDVAAEGDCSFCGYRETYPIVGVERFRGETEGVPATGAPVRICSACVERAAAAVRPS